MSNKHYVGLDITGFKNNGKRLPISRVTLMLDDENTLTAGDDTGAELLATCPHATQEMVDKILLQVSGYQYQMYSANAASLDPAAELGDGITVSGIYSVISQMDENGRGYYNLSAPGEEETEDEYPSGGPVTREFSRKIAETKSLITKTANEIRLKVSSEIEELSSSLAVTLDEITASVRGLDGAYAELKVTVDGVTVTDSSGTTLIKGSSIDTSTIKANSISADKLNLTGEIAFEDLDGATQIKINSAKNAADTANNAVSGWTYPGTTYINGSMLMTNTVRASTLEGGSVSLLTAAEHTGGVITITGATTANYAVDLTSYGSLRLNANYGAVYLQSGYGTSLLLSSGEISAGGGNFRPANANTYSCGTASWYWTDVYAANATIQASDLTIKKDVVYGLEDYDAFFDGLRPMSFVFTDGSRRHMGMGAQDVEQNLEDSGLTSMDFAGFIKSPKVDEDGQTIEGEYVYALRYGEFIPLCIEQIQRLKRRVSALEGT